MVSGRYKTKLLVALLLNWLWLRADALSGKYVCIEKQKYNLTKVIKVRAPVAVRSYEWCLAIPPRCERWHTELRDVTRLETEERSADIPVCCAGFAVRDERCVPRCPPGRMGQTCNIGCPDGQWGASCTHQCICPRFSTCDPKDGKCICTEGWTGPSCDQKKDALEVTHIPGLGMFNWKTGTTTKRYSPSITTTSVNETTTLTSVIATAATSQTTTTPITDLSTTTTSVTVPSTMTTSVITSMAPIPTISKTPFTTKIDITTSTDRTQTEEQTTTTIHDKLTPTFTTTRLNEKTNNLTNTTETNTNNASETSNVTILKSTVKNGGSQVASNISITSTELSKLTTSVQTEEPPKEIWIKPAQQGENKSSETKLKSITEYQRPSTKRPDTTTVRTIILSIIPSSNSTTVAQYIPNHSHVYKLKGIPNSESRIVNITKYPTSSTTRLNPTKIMKANTQHTKSTPKYATFETNLPLPTPNITSIVNILEITTNNIKPTSSTTIKAMHVILKKDSHTAITRIPKTIIEKKFQSTSGENENINFTDVTPTPNVRLTDSIKIKNGIVQSSVTEKSSTNIITTTISKIAIANPSNKSHSNHVTSAATISLLKTASTTPKPILLKETTPIAEASKVTRKIIPIQKINITKSSSTVTVNTQNRDKPVLARKIAETVTTRIPNVMHFITSYPFFVNRTTTNTLTHSNVTEKEINMLLKDVKNTTNAKNTMTKVTKSETNTTELTTKNSLLNEEETFNILTEPEHITSIIGEGNVERGGTDDLLSLLSIVGGGMMAVILVAVLIVMMERCRKSQHGGSVMDKTEDLDLKVAVQSHQGKSYVRSIFHSPLPEPPVYRDMKPIEQTNYMGQFSRPVVLHELSPALIDNFRGILESHYDHLPQRSSRPLTTVGEQCCDSDILLPSIENLHKEVCSIPKCQDYQHLHNRLYPVTESAIETLKLESNIPQVDYANIEPLYAEIPCWRPQSHYANEIVNLNSEAVTEL